MTGQKFDKSLYTNPKKRKCESTFKITSNMAKYPSIAKIDPLGTKLDADLQNMLAAIHVGFLILALTVEHFGQSKWGRDPLSSFLGEEFSSFDWLLVAIRWELIVMTIFVFMQSIRAVRLRHQSGPRVQEMASEILDTLGAKTLLGKFFVLFIFMVITLLFLTIFSALGYFFITIVFNPFADSVKTIFAAAGIAFMAFGAMTGFAIAATFFMYACLGFRKLFPGVGVD